MTPHFNKGKKRTKEQNERNRLAHLGKKHSEETKQKMTEIHKKLYPAKADVFKNTGKTHFKKGMTAWNKDKVGVMPEPHNKGVDTKKAYECELCMKRFKAYAKRKYCSTICSSIEKQGDKNHNWIGGSWLYVRKQILIEQDYTCQDCGFQEREIMEVNHKLERADYPELARDKNNLEVLCPNCHRRKTNRFLANKKQ